MEKEIKKTLKGKELLYMFDFKYKDSRVKILLEKILISKEEVIYLLSITSNYGSEVKRFNDLVIAELEYKEKCFKYFKF